MTPEDRILPLEGVENFRDYGGYAVPGGLRVVRGRLWRSAHHGAATDDDLARIAGLGLTAVVDLRRPTERANQPSRRPDGFAGRVIDCDAGDQAEPPHVAFLRKTDLSAESARAFFLDYYRKAPFEPRHLELFGRYFEALDMGRPVLIHCTAGKDRTGLLAALTHHLLGVDEADLLADFELTNRAARIETRLPQVTEAMTESLGRRPSETAVRAFLGVDRTYLAEAFGAIRREAGSVEAYLAGLGLDGARVEHLRRTWLEPAQA
ncbi:MAG: tyrosine-protein phosphatase [Phenylobacterium sp.]|jgi:protein tyrosine/serine phosphatase